MPVSVPTPAATQGERLLSIQLARGVAATLVVLYHGSRMVALPQYTGHEGFNGFFSFGHAGVDFFFVLSGFIIYFVHHSDLGQPKRLPRYGWRRITRIYPTYWLVLSVSVGLLVLKHDPSFSTTHLIKSALLVPDTQEPLLGVAWTLLHEMLFYVVFAIGILDLRLGILAAALWIGAVVQHSGFADPILRVASATRNIQFLLGIAAALIVLHTRPRFAIWIGVIGVGAFVATGLAENAQLIAWDGTFGSMIFGGCAAIAIVGLASAEREGTLTVGPIGEFLGGTSYLLYLIHTIVVGLTFRALMYMHLIRSLPIWFSVTIAACAAIAFASLLYKFVEKPVQAALGRFGRDYVYARKATA